MFAEVFLCLATLFFECSFFLTEYLIPQNQSGLHDIYIMWSQE